MSALDQCEQCFFSEEDYIEHVVVEIRDSCIKSKEKNPKKFLNAVTTNGTIHQCIVDVSFTFAHQIIACYVMYICISTL